jgi:hypothetical protein
MFAAPIPPPPPPLIVDPRLKLLPDETGFAGSGGRSGLTVGLDGFTTGAAGAGAAIVA